MSVCCACLSVRSAYPSASVACLQNGVAWFEFRFLGGDLNFIELDDKMKFMMVWNRRLRLLMKSLTISFNHNGVTINFRKTYSF